jgi:hypothetical protein
MFYILTQTNIHLANAIQRYARFVLEVNVGGPTWTGRPLSTDDKLIIFRGEEHLLRVDCISLGRFETSIFFIGFSRRSHIDLSNLEEAMSRLVILLTTNAFDPERIISPNRSLFDRARLLFSGHGEDSLLEELNYVRYYVMNGPKLFLMGQIDRPEMITVFLGPATNHWNQFEQRIRQYYLDICDLGFSTEMKTVDRLIESFHEFVHLSKRVLDNPAMVNMLDEDFIEKHLANLDKTNDILNKIDQGQQVASKQLQNPRR